MKDKQGRLKDRVVWAGAFPLAVLIYCALVVSAAFPKRRTTPAPGARNDWGLPQPVDLA
ncbi:MAG: hypothetical protein GTO46_16720 [Gemmatimonadetes bacterium]|nr:hypothetical protein [Gemmatimonadota bacterium]NIO33353.1 hypothetical protein [Gemmatimonadota bacterium]